VAKAYNPPVSAHVFQAPIVTSIELGRMFYRADDDHQDFRLKIWAIRILFNDLRNIANLKQLFPSFTADSMLVGVVRS
jgi:peptide-methionine (S)-S-oxide reductase